MNALTPEELQSIARHYRIPVNDIPKYAFNPQDPNLPPELKDVVMSVNVLNYVLNTVNFDPQRVNRVGRVIEYLMKNNLFGDQPLVYQGVLSPDGRPVVVIPPRPDQVIPPQQPVIDERVIPDNSVPRQISCIPSVYRGAGKEGDFLWMLQQPRYNRCLFVYPDSEDSFHDYISTNPRRDPCKSPQRGTVSQLLRPYRCINPPRALGIPIRKGPHYYSFPGLDTSQQAVDKAKLIAEATNMVKRALMTGQYDCLFFSADINDQQFADHRVTGWIRYTITENLFNAVKEANQVLSRR